MKKLLGILREWKEGILISGIVITVLGLVAWYKGGGNFDSTVGILIGFFFLFVILLIAGLIAMFVKDYLDEKQSKIRNPYIKFFITRAALVGAVILMFFLVIKIL